MALIDTYCGACDRYDEVDRPFSQWPATPPCSTCGGPTEQRHLPPSARAQPDPVVVYRTPGGDFRFPGDGNGVLAARYHKLGYERVELRGHQDVRRFEHQMGKKEYEKVCRSVERKCEMMEKGLSGRRRDIRTGLEQGFQIPEIDSKGRRTGRMKLVRMSELGKGVMRRAMDQTDARPSPKAYDTGFHIDAYSNDRSNRAESRDDHGKRRRD